MVIKKINKNKIFIVVPAYNEEKNIKKTINSIIKKGYSNIIVVDDGSRDNTYEKAKKTNTYLLKHIINLGKGASMKTAVEFAISLGAGYIVFMDADGQHSVDDLIKFQRALTNYDFVFGYRKRDFNMPFISKIGNIFFDFFLNAFFGVKIKDTQSGFRAFNTKIYKKIKWKAKDYAVETEISIKVIKNKIKYTEIPIKTIYYDKYKGTTPFHGLKILLKIIKWRFGR